MNLDPCFPTQETDKFGKSDFPTGSRLVSSPKVNSLTHDSRVDRPSLKFTEAVSIGVSKWTGQAAGAEFRR